MTDPEKQLVQELTAAFLLLAGAINRIADKLEEEIDDREK